MKGSLLLLAVSCVVTLSAAEAGLRWLGHHGAPGSTISNTFSVDDPILDWRYVPRSEVRVGRVVYRYNGAGFRDVDHAIAKPPEAKRIVVLGDSVTEGYGVEWRDVFAHVLQARLGNGWEVINIAAGGLNTPQEVHLLERAGLIYEPDLVVVNFVLNDADFDSKREGARRYLADKDTRIGLLNLPVTPGLKQLLKSSALIYFVKERVELLKGRLVDAEEPNYFRQLWAKPENREKVQAAFRKLAALQARARFQVLVIIWPLLTDFDRYGVEFVHDWVGREARQAGFPVIDLLERFSRIPYRELQVTADDNVHPNALGHQLAVDAFLAWYRTRG
jgi:lysophospholipase L1-like esterase